VQALRRFRILAHTASNYSVFAMSIASSWQPVISSLSASECRLAIVTVFSNMNIRIATPLRGLRLTKSWDPVLTYGDLTA
jgi:hypothetical protein